MPCLVATPRVAGYHLGTICATPSPMLTLLLTRPEKQSRAFASELERRLPRRFRVLISPVLAIQPRQDPIDVANSALLAFTSANAVEAFAALCPDRSLLAFCVGASTQATARALGFRTCSADGDARALARLIAAESAGPILHLRGAQAAVSLLELLPGRMIREHVVYDQVPLPPTPEAAAAGRTGRLDVLTVFSPRSGRLLAEAARGWDLRRATSVAISEAANGALGALPARRLVAESPSREGMVASLARL